jgi:Tfp pilus assembly protein PilF
MEDFDRCIANDPKDTRALYARALLRQQTNDLAGALEDLNRAIEISPNDAGFHIVRGDVKRASGDLRSSERVYHASAITSIGE